MVDGGIFGIPQRQAPANAVAEQGLLGAVLTNNRAFDRCEFLKPEHFSDPLHGWIYGECRNRVVKGQIADPVTLKVALQNAPQWELYGEAPSYFARLIGATVSLINVRDYGQVIVDAAIRRALIDIGERVVNLAFGTDPALSAEAIARSCLSEIEAAASLAPSTTNLTSLNDAMDSALAAMERARAGEGTNGISTGFQCIDHRLGGLEPGMVYVIAGRPGMGKSSIGHQIAINAARSGVSVLELSLEMSAKQLGRRTLATAAAVPIMGLKRGAVSVLDASNIVHARKELAGLPLMIDDAGGQTAAQIAAKARTHRRKNGLGLIMVDHLNLMRADDADAKHGGTWSIERASATMLQLAKDCECPVLMLAQLNRGVEARDDKRPGLSDLRQAGAIEQDAYAVGFVYRAEYYLGGEPEQKTGESSAKFQERRGDWLDQKAALAGKAELIWGKVRDGEPGTDPLLFHGPTATFSETEI